MVDKVIEAGGLVRYERAQAALAECRSVDEVKDIVDKAAAMKIYAMQAKNKTLEVDAAEIRIRAERRLGEMLTAQKASEGGLSKGGRPPEKTGRPERPVSPTLSDAGISKDLSSRAQAIAAVPEKEFESEVATWRDRVSQEGERVTARLVAKGKGNSQPVDGDVVARLKTECAELREENAYLREEIDSMMRVLEADEQVTQALGEAKRFRELNRQLNERFRGLQNERNAAIGAAKAARRAAAGVN
jgi:hypothetical protein